MDNLCNCVEKVEDKPVLGFPLGKGLVKIGRSIALRVTSESNSCKKFNIQSKQIRILLGNALKAAFPIQ